MHIRSKNWLKFVFSVLVFLAIFLVWALDAVDYEPYFLTQYYQTTTARLDSLLQSTDLYTGAIEVGLGKASLTPHPSREEDDPLKGEFKAVPLAGYSDRESNPATAVHDSLFVKAVAIRVSGQTLLMVSLEALIVPVEIAAAVAEKVHESTGLDRTQILFSATHTHSGPGAWGEGWLAEQFAGQYNPAVQRWLIRQTVRAIERACVDLTPAQIGNSSFSAPQFVKNRLVGNLGWVNDAFDVLVFRQADGDQAVLGIYSAHATVLPAENMQFSGDYPGYWQRAIEKQVPGMALFFAGSVGSHGPAEIARDFKSAQKIGEALANSVLTELPKIMFQDTVAISSLGLPVELPELHVRLTSGIRFTPTLAKLLLDTDSTYLQAFRLGNLLWVSTPCDFSGEMAIELKNLAGQNGFHAIISSFNGSYTGYLIPGKYYYYNSYESRIMSWFGPYIGDYFDELIRRMMLGVVRL
ncbi:MAG: neutral/alkaline non-lysosomal ceramidase N-terminal domain-containing protein [bacterium]